MLNIELYLEDQLVELTDAVSFPLNKSFQNLWNPTDIIVEYSKSINVPATANNNKLMANAYRLDRQYVVGGATNIGMYLDPLKRIPMKLMYNGSIILDGYAKYTSASSDGTNTYYTFNLYGALGDIFQKLLECVFDENKLTDEQKAESDNGAKYIITTPWEAQIINRSFVKTSWDTTDINYDYKFSPFNSIGFAPAYRGNYDDFESSSALGLNWYTILDGAFPTEPKSVEDELKNRWRINLINEHDYTSENAEARVDAIDYSVVIGQNGLNEHQMQQFRSYEQKPYIYFYSLLRMYQEKCKELTGYTINLDPTWFTVNNPYYSKLCYMLDYLSVKGNTLQSSLPFTGYYKEPWDSFPTTSVSYEITDSELLSKGDITTESFTLMIENKFKPFSDDTNPSYCHVGINSNVEVLLEITTTTNGTSTKTYFWGGLDYSLAGSSSSNYNKNNFITLTERDNFDYDNNKAVGQTFMTVPSFKIPHTAGDDLSVTYKVTVNRHYVAGSYYSFYYGYNGKHRTYIYPTSGSDDFTVTIPNVEYQSNWRNSTTCEMKNLWTKDESMFNVILQYTKMFGLIWKPDYTNKKIDILTRQTYFKDYEIVDWTDKIDKSKGMTIEPVSFNSKYLLFNYNSVDGYRYSGYKSKYGVNYGEKKMTTKYNFDTKTTNIFENIKLNPSSASTKSFATIYDLKSWDTINTLPSKPSEIDFIDAENDDQTGSIAINNWYFRGANKTTTSEYRITDVSTPELQQGKYYWLGNGLADYYGIATITTTLPQFSPVYQAGETGFVNLIGTPVGCLYTCPSEDYTQTKTITDANGNYVYDICWNDYIQERYNTNNKKVTCYVNLQPIEFQQFNFKKFVTVDNQLFSVNKIIDYNVNNPITKVELIQVNDINKYMTQRLQFPVIAYDRGSIEIETTTDSYGASGYGSITISAYPYITSSEVEIIAVSKGSDASVCFVEDTELDNTNTTLYITYESDGTYTEEYKLVITAENETVEIPIYVN